MQKTVYLHIIHIAGQRAPRIVHFDAACLNQHWFATRDRSRIKFLHIEIVGSGCEMFREDSSIFKSFLGILVAMLHADSEARVRIFPSCFGKR